MGDLRGEVANIKAGAAHALAVLEPATTCEPHVPGFQPQVTHKKRFFQTGRPRLRLAVPAADGDDEQECQERGMARRLHLRPL